MLQASLCCNKTPKHIHFAGHKYLRVTKFKVYASSRNKQKACEGCSFQKALFSCNSSVYMVYSVACEGWGERGDGPRHSMQGGTQRAKLQKLKCCCWMIFLL